MASNMGLSFLASSPDEKQEQKTVGKMAIENKTSSILVLDDDFDINNIIKMSPEAWIQCLWFHGSNVGIGRF
jgi:hypothetical protein